MLSAEQVKRMMHHKDDIVYGVIKRCEYEIHAAALKGDSGIVFKYPAEFDGYLEIEVLFFNALELNGYFVVDKGVEGVEHVVEIYWNY